MITFTAATSSPATGADITDPSPSPHQFDVVAYMDDEGDAIPSSPPGWTLEVHTFSTFDGGNAAVWYNPDSVDAAASLTFGAAFSSQVTAACSYTGVDGATPINALATDQNSDGAGTSHTIPMPSVTTTVPNCRVLLIVHLDLNSGATRSWIAPAGYTFRASQDTSEQSGVAIFDGLKATPGATGVQIVTLDFSAADSVGWVAHTIALAPAGAAGLHGELLLM